MRGSRRQSRPAPSWPISSSLTRITKRRIVAQNLRNHDEPASEEKETSGETKNYQVDLAIAIYDKLYASAEREVYRS